VRCRTIPMVTPRQPRLLRLDDRDPHRVCGVVRNWVWLHSIAAGRWRRRRFMRIARFIRVVCAVLACGCAAAPPAPTSPAPSGSRPSPLILEKNEGERRVFRGWPGHPDPGSTFVLKVDPKNGGSSHLVFLTEDLSPGESIPRAGYFLHPHVQ
jgi:hypothetical protein